MKAQGIKANVQSLVKVPRTTDNICKYYTTSFNNKSQSSLQFHEKRRSHQDKLAPLPVKLLTSTCEASTPNLPTCPALLRKPPKFNEYADKNAMTDKQISKVEIQGRCKKFEQGEKAPDPKEAAMAFISSLPDNMQTAYQRGANAAATIQFKPRATLKESQSTAKGLRYSKHSVYKTES